MKATSLYNRLKNYRIKCALSNEGNPKLFLPIDIIEREITKDEIRTSLFPSFFARLFALGSNVPDQIVENAKRVFAVLVLIGGESHIETLLRDGLNDTFLPLRRTSMDETTSSLISPGGRIFASFEGWTDLGIDRFLENQWAVLAPILENNGEDVMLDPRHVLPLTSLHKITRGQYSDVSHCELHPAHQRGLQVSGCGIDVAVKEFHLKSTHEFVQERNNLARIRRLKHPHLIQHYGTFDTGEQYYVIFPWAEGGNLKDYWKQNDTATRDVELALWCFRQMLGVTGALEALHDINCRHGDLKPENILRSRLTDNDVLVVADVGVSRVHQHSTMLRNSPTVSNATTPAYEAPEAVTEKQLARSRLYDIWSLGCIFLEFCAWFLDGNDSVDSFNADRAPRQIPGSRSYFYQLSSSRTAEVHPAVTNKIKELQNDPRCVGDTALYAFLDLIADKLLRIAPEHRDDAHQVYEKLQQIVRKIEVDQDYAFNRVVTLSSS